ncbi:mspA family protein, partial [Nocardia sp. NPDC051787]
MSENRTMRRGARVAGIGAAAAVAMGLLSTGAANADTFVPLPDGHKVGPGVTITRNGERALISPSLAANGAGRVVWVSGNAIADVAVTPEGEIGPNNGPTGNPGTN